MTIRTVLGSLLLLAATSGSTHANVLVVNAAGGAPFTQIQAAVDAASDGDVILVKPGNYAGFTVTNRALDIVGDSGGVVRIDGNVLVLSLAASRTFTLSGVKIFGSSGYPALRFAFCSGSVRVEGCLLQEGPAPCADFWSGSEGLDVDVCADVSIARCTIAGGDGGGIPSDGGYGGSGGYGAHPVQSRIAFYDCALLGGAGGGVAPGVCAGTFGYGYGGGTGGRFVGCPVVFGSGSSFEGGRGSWGGVGFPSSDGGGGTGRQLISTAPYGDTHAWWLDTAAIAGAPGCPGCPSGVTESVFPATTMSTTLAGTARRFVVRAVARESELVRLRFEGQPGDRVELFISDAPRFAFSTSWKGVLLVRAGGASPVLQAGTIGPSGVLEIPWVVNELGALVQSRRLLMQPSFIDASGQATLGTPHTLVLLDSAF